MIKHELLRERRESLGLSQTDVVSRVSKITDGLSQPGYAKIEQGKVERSKYLPYICQALGLSLHEIDDTIDEDFDALFSRLQSLPRDKQVEIIERLLAEFKR